MRYTVRRRTRYIRNHKTQRRDRVRVFVVVDRQLGIDRWGPFLTLDDAMARMYAVREGRLR